MSRTPRILLAALLLAGSSWGQQGRFGGQDFRLSAQASLAEDSRGFVLTDVLHMGVRGPALPLDGSSPGPATGRWSLERPEGSFGGPLDEDPEGWLVGQLDLAQLPRVSAVWTWRAELFVGGTLRYAPTAQVEILLEAPRAAFEASTGGGLLPLSVAFQDRSQGQISSWLWDFGDGAQSAEPDPVHEYTLEGSFHPSLTVGNASGSDTWIAPEPIVVQTPPPADPDFAILYGANSSENVWSQRGIAFADAMARASEFTLMVNGTLQATLAPLIPAGEPGAAWPDLSQLAPGVQAAARLFGSMAGSTPDGRGDPYVLTWEGTGSCRLAGNPVMAEANRGSNRVEVFVDPTVGSGNALLVWVLEASDPADPVRNAHVWLPGMELDQPLLWPPFVEKLQAMNGGRGPSTWRAMDWNQVRQYGRTDGAAPFVFDLAGRITPASPSQGTRRGVCPEFIVALCNSVGSDLHFCLPHAADDIPDADYETFVRETLLAIRDGSPGVPGVNGGRPFAGLDPELHLTLEYSNEIWNPGYPVRGWLRARAQQNGITYYEQSAREIERVFAIADQIFAGPEAPRLHHYVAGWLGSADHLAGLLSFLDPALQIDQVGPACYFKPLSTDVDAWMTDAVPGSCPNCPSPEEVLASARVYLQSLRPRLGEHRALADSWVNPDGSSPRLVLYEAGPSFVAGFQPWAAAAVQAQRIPAMFDAYVLDLVPLLIEEGVDEVLWYSFVSDNGAQGDGAGPFGHWDDMTRTITLPVPDPYLDEGQPKAAAIYRLPPLR